VRRVEPERERDGAVTSALRAEFLSVLYIVSRMVADGHSVSGCIVTESLEATAMQPNTLKRL